jgi:3-keto-L-gulonate-6-phosphate decarboxylase
MVDMMNVEQPVKIMRKLAKQPNVVILHRGVDEETFNKNKPIPYIQINKVRATFDVLISIGGGDTIREVERAIFNGANIVLVWKEFYQATSQTAQLAQEFLDVIRH